MFAYRNQGRSPSQCYVLGALGKARSFEMQQNGHTYSHCRTWTYASSENDAYASAISTFPFSPLVTPLSAVDLGTTSARPIG